MSDGVPKSRVTLTYDTKQPAGREKPRELPFRLLVLGDVSGAKDAPPLAERKVRQLNGRNLGEVIRGLNIAVCGVELGDGAAARPIDVPIDSMSSFSPDEILKLLTGQKPKDEKATRRVLGPTLQSSSATAPAQTFHPGDSVLKERWATREKIVSFQKAYQNSKVLRGALKRFSSAPAADDAAEQQARKDAIARLKKTGDVAAQAQRLTDEAKKAQKLALDAEKALQRAKDFKAKFEAELVKSPNDARVKKLADDAKSLEALADAAAKGQKDAADKALMLAADAVKLQKLVADSATAEQRAADATAALKAATDAETKALADAAAAKKLADDAATKVPPGDDLKDLQKAAAAAEKLATAATQAKKAPTDMEKSATDAVKEPKKAADEATTKLGTDAAAARTLAEAAATAAKAADAAATQLADATKGGS